MKHHDDADYVILVPTEKLATPNPPRRRKTLEHPALDSGEYDRFLVKTALIRSESWNASSKISIKNDADLYGVVKHIAHYDQEHMVSVAISNGGFLVAIHEVAIGGPSNVEAALKMLVKVAFLTNSSGVFLVHNHPSGDPTPSGADIAFTRAVNEGIDCYGISLLDHLIVGGGSYFSFHQRDLI